MVFSDGVNLLMKPIMAPSAASFKKIIQDSHRYAKETGLKKSDVEETIQKVRRRARRS
jgi:antitoxin PrlF